MKRKILILCISILLIASCGNVKLSNGENAVVTFKDDEGISVEEFYEVLKDTYGASNLVNVIDTYLLKKEYSSTDEEKEYVNQVLSSIKANAESYGTDYLTYLKNNYGMNSEEAFKDYVILNYRRTLWINDYAKKQVTDKQIEEYYEEYSIGDIEARHILITPKVTDDMTEDEKNAAEEEALNTAKDLLKKIKNEEDFIKIAKEYSEDESNAADGGKLDPFNRGEMDENFEAAAVKLEVGKFSTEPVKSAFGYHLIYKISQKDKPSLEDAKEGIIEIIAKESLEAADTTVYTNAIEALRSKYEMKIKDSELEAEYNKLITGTNEASN